MRDHLVRQIQRDRAEFVRTERVLRAEAQSCSRAVARIDRLLAEEARVAQ